MTLRTLDHRADLGHLCNELNLQTAVEVGTHQGVFAYEFMARFNGKLACVDPWKDESPPPHKTFQPCFVTDSPGRHFDCALARFVLTSLYPGRVTLHKTTSLEFAAGLKDASVGFVYIDGLHDIPSVKADILAFWPKLYPGGILAGHDYVFGDPRPLGDITLFGVAAVVNWFAVDRGLDLWVTNEPIPSWYFRKPI